MERGGHSRGVDDTVQQNRNARQGVSRRADSRRLTRAREDIAGAKVQVNADGTATLQ